MHVDELRVDGTSTPDCMSRIYPSLRSFLLGSSQLRVRGKMDPGSALFLRWSSGQFLHALLCSKTAVIIG